ncbi:1,4-alpha-glucan branching protein GlgB [Tomitella biformata]|uniref:1,4-alpha-glucan branching protein GlgB n=1 Tax=Tomitella biformata TaxID=630403 RepID=UPI000463F499|nr:1,4-alpha-glucan branching protein GlgB [Tomitella biformata]
MIHPVDLDPEDRALLIAGTHPDPHSLFGPFPHPRGTLVRALKPDAQCVTVRTEQASYPLQSMGDGVFAAVLDTDELPDYRLVVTYAPGRVFVVPDGYLLPPTISPADLELFAAGRHPRLWEVLGAQPMLASTPSGAIAGTAFTVWAPHAAGVAVVGDFDGWTGFSAPMRRLDCGVWEVFVPDLEAGELYKFRIRDSSGDPRDRADPMARAAELPSKTASRIDAGGLNAAGYRWRDGAWLRRRGNLRTQPMSVFEVHLGSWRVGLSYRELAVELVAYVRELGFTHVELLPVCEHPYGASWGYQVTSYFAPTSRYGSPDELRALLDAFHVAGIGIIIDWVPAHFPRDGFALAEFDGEPLYEPADPQLANQPDWGTLAFDLERPEVRGFLIASALYWAEQFHVDGIRVDAVASMLYLDYSREPGQWTPNIHGGPENLAAVSFLRELTDTVAAAHPSVAMIAEDSTSWPGVTRPTALGGLGFTFKWNLGWMNDTLVYHSRAPEHRSFHHAEITYPLTYAWGESYLLPISHDEVVHGKGTPFARLPGDPDAKAAGTRALLAMMWAHPGKQLLFMGQEYGQSTEWSEFYGLDWSQLRDPLHRGIRDHVATLNRHYRATPALWQLDDSPDGFEWVDAHDVINSVVSFLRLGSSPADRLLCIANFADREHVGYRVGTPVGGEWRIMLDSAGAPGRLLAAEQIACHGRDASITLTLAAHSTVWLVPGGGDA